jgi:hypothetical protein
MIPYLREGVIGETVGFPYYYRILREPLKIKRRGFGGTLSSPIIV